jgi:hypothetical protein
METVKLLTLCDGKITEIKLEVVEIDGRKMLCLPDEASTKKEVK